MYIIVLVLVLLFLGVLLPLLMPILIIAAGIILALKLGRTFLAKTNGRYDEKPYRGDRLNPDNGEPEQEFREQKGSSGTGYQLPRSVKDDEFWEQEHQVLDVPFEETVENQDSSKE